MMQPTVGRDLHFWVNGGLSAVAHDPAHPLAAKIARVWSDRMVNLMVIDANGLPFNRTSVTLVQEGDTVPRSGQYYACWPKIVTQVPQPALWIKDLPGSTSGSGPSTGATFAMGSSSTDDAS